MPKPRTRKQLRSTLGFFGYFRKYIKDYSRIVSPLQVQLRGGSKDDKSHAKSKVDWEDTAVQGAWTTLTSALGTAPILAHPDWNTPFAVHVDACKHGLGATLTQTHSDGSENVIMYASKSLTDIEQKYQTWELEAYACVWAVSSVFKPYLLPPYGRRFTLHTDNSAISSLFDPAKKLGFSSRVAHWKLRLSEYDYEIKHHPGKQNIVADTLSRCSLLETCPYGEPQESPLYQVHSTKEPPPIPANAVAHFPPEDETADTLAQFVERQQDDEGCTKLRDALSKDKNLPFEVDPSTHALYHVATTLDIDKQDRTLRRLVVPESLKRFIIQRAHGLTHSGAKRTLRQISARYHWTGMVEEITRWCACCLICRKRKTSRPWGDGIPKTMSCVRPLQRVACDLLGNFAASDGHTFILTMIDVFTRFTLAVPIPNKQPATIAQAIFDRLICVFGIPESILTDQGTEFVNHGLKSMCRTFGIRKIRCSPHSNSKGNGHIERFHRFVNSSMYALQISLGPKWSGYTHAVCFAYNLVANESTGFSPHYLMFGRQPTLPDDVCFGFKSQIETAIQENYHIHAAKVMKDVYQRVHQRQLAISERNRAARELDNEPPNYEVGTAVLLFQPGQPAYTVADGDPSIVAHSPKKWTPQWTGPHTISQCKGPNNYDVIHGKTGTIFRDQNVNSIFPWNPWSETVSSTSEEKDLLVPWTFGGLPKPDSFIAVPLESSFEVGRLLKGPTTLDEPLSFQWWSNATNDHSSAIRPGWHKPISGKPGDPYYRSEKRHASDKPWTNVETETTTTSEDIMLNGFALTKHSKIPKPVEWAAENSRKLYYDEPHDEDKVH